MNFPNFDMHTILVVEASRPGLGKGIQLHMAVCFVYTGCKL